MGRPLMGSEEALSFHATASRGIKSERKLKWLYSLGYLAEAGLKPFPLSPLVERAVEPHLHEQPVPAEPEHGKRGVDGGGRWLRGGAAALEGDLVRGRGRGRGRARGSVRLGLGVGVALGWGWG